MKQYIQFYKRAFDFSGRSSRKDFWVAFLIPILIATILSVFDNAYGFTEGDRLGPLEAVYLLISFIPIISLAVRRLHDMNKRAGLLFVTIIPVLGPILLLMILAKKGEPA